LVLDRLRREGLTRQADPARPPESARSEARDSWTLDVGAADAALISPLLRDTPGSWEGLRLALAAVAARRGAPSRLTTATIDVGLAPHGDLTHRHMALLRLAAAYHDVLHRLGTDPRDARPGVPAPGGARPLPANGFAESAAVDGTRAETWLGPIPMNGHIGFDFFGASLEPAVVQAHVKLALALVAAVPPADEAAPGRPAPTPRDAHRDAPQRVLVAIGAVLPSAPLVYALDQHSDTRRVTELLGAVFRREADIVQQLSLAAVTPWPGARPLLDDPDEARRLVERARSRILVSDGGVAFPARSLPRERYEDLDARAAAERFAPRLLRTVVDAQAGGVVTVFDGLAVTPDAFAALLPLAARRHRAGLLLTFARTDAGPRPLPPRPDDWPRLLGWSRRLADVLETGVYVRVAADTHLRSVPRSDLTEFQAFGATEVARLLRDWRAEPPSAAFVLGYVPADAPRPADGSPGLALVALPDGAPVPDPPLLAQLRRTLAALPAVRQAAAPRAIAGPPDEGAYLSHSEAFDAVAGDVAARLAEGAPPLPYVVDEPRGGPRFEFELEFTLAGGATAADVRAELRAAGFTRWAVSDAEGEHGVAVLRGSSSLDVPGTWRELADVLAIARRHGEATVPGTLGAVRVDVTHFGRSVRRHEALLMLAATYRDVLRRVATDPVSVSGGPPHPAPAIHDVGFVSLPPWDGTLDPALIQTRTRIWLGLVDAAARLADPPVLSRVAHPAPAEAEPAVVTAPVAAASRPDAGSPVLSRGAHPVPVEGASARPDASSPVPSLAARPAPVEAAASRSGTGLPVPSRVARPASAEAGAAVVTAPGAAAARPGPGSPVLARAVASGWESARGAVAAGRPGAVPPAAVPLALRVRYPGAGALLSGRVAVYEPEPAARTEAARRLFDSVLSRPSDRAQAAALFHITPWPGAPVRRVHAARGEGWAVFGDPADPRRVAAERDAAAYRPPFDEPAFVVAVGLDPAHGVPMVHGGVGAAPVTPETFATLLAAAGRPPDAAVALEVGGPWPDPSALLGWLRDLAAGLDAPVSLRTTGRRVADLADETLAGFGVFAPPGAVPPGADWWLTPSSDAWLRYDPGGAAVAGALTPLPDSRLREFTRLASWQGTDIGVVFAEPSALAGVVRRLERVEAPDGLVTAVFARSRHGVPQVWVRGAERDLTPAEFAAVLARLADAPSAAELRLVVLDVRDPDPRAAAAWARGIAAATGRTVYTAAPGTAAVMPAGRRRRGGPYDIRLAPEPGAAPSGSRWLVTTPAGRPGPGTFTDIDGRLRPASEQSAPPEPEEPA
jgi:hypothetical protein